MVLVLVSKQVGFEIIQGYDLDTDALRTYNSRRLWGAWVRVWHTDSTTLRLPAPESVVVYDHVAV